MNTLGKLMALAVLIQSSTAVANGSQVVLGLDEAALRARIGIEDWPSPRLSASGVRYICSTAKNGHDRVWRVGVYPTIEIAKTQFQQQVTGYAARNVWPAGEPPIGDEMMWTQSTSGQASQILFRRKNVVILFGRRAAQTEVFAAARQMDQLIQTDRDIAPFGTATSLPKITGVGAPTRVTARDSVWEHHVRLQPEIEGLPSLDGLRVFVVRAGEVGVWNNLRPGTGEPVKKFLKPDPATGRRRYVDAVEDQRLMMRTPVEPGTYTYKLVVQTEGNLILTKEFEIEVVAAE